MQKTIAFFLLITPILGRIQHLPSVFCGKFQNLFTKVLKNGNVKSHYCRFLNFLPTIQKTFSDFILKF